MSLVRIGDVESVWDDLVGIYKECWAHKLHLPHHAPETFGPERMTAGGTAPARSPSRPSQGLLRSRSKR